MVLTFTTVQFAWTQEAELARFKGLEGKIDIAGGTAHIPVMKEAAERIMKANPKIRITVAGGGTGVGSVGGIGTRGPGERQIEIDRRIVNRRVTMLKRQIVEIDAREGNLKTELSRLETERTGLASDADPDTLQRYERLRRTKGERVVVGIAHGVCGGCHMRLPAQILISCQTSQELVPCSNCGRILYYTRDMSLVPTE